MAPPTKAQNKQKEEGFGKEKFIYQADSDTYLCPSAVQLTTNGKWYNKRKDSAGNPIYRFKRYEAPASICSACQFLGKCTKVHNGHGRYIERSEYDEQIEENRQRVLANKNYYRQRQAMVEHPFGTIKRSMGYSYTLLKSKAKVSAEFALIFTCYNLKRVINILGVKELLRRLKGLFSAYWKQQNC